MKLLIYKHLGRINNNLYVIIENNEAILIDAPIGTIKLIEELKGIKINSVLLTHGHPDHITEAKKLQEKGIKIIANEKDSTMMLLPWKFILLKANPLHSDLEINDNENIKLGKITINAIHTPGHTNGGICYYIKEKNMIFTGDTLFKDTIGRTDLPGGNNKQLLNNIKEKLFTLPEKTIVYPGHGDKTTIGYEKKNNPFFNQ